MAMQVFPLLVLSHDGVWVLVLSGAVVCVACFEWRWCLGCLFTVVLVFALLVLSGAWVCVTCFEWCRCLGCLF